MSSMFPTGVGTMYRVPIICYRSATALETLLPSHRTTAGKTSAVADVYVTNVDNYYPPTKKTIDSLQFLKRLCTFVSK
ncbi:hypothetical protein HMPREF0658_1540 [Hoylesella marshii DSM 16973 = JCM 13450]|uniref:Uncharacterized protein n=1 Tax=Hoylesella marshii DSM 16973 = JCM 13450 TaxID=862515 RepID=E0NTN7_9BACT|nr:hypothetical protein HMPREF0658_1540 [Hoylesella marshii DSM 16973 = JCM 13450]